MINVIKTVLVVIVLSFFFSIPAIAESYDDGFQAMQHGDYAMALQIFRPLAEKGSIGAEYNLAVMYAEGKGVPVDYTEAFKWYHKAADQGAVVAEYNLADMYTQGKGVPQNYPEAIAWYQKAANHGMAAAQFNLAVIYAKGTGTPINQVEAYKWASLANTHFPSSAVEYRLQAASLLKILAGEMNPQQISDAQKLVEEWKATPPPPAAMQRPKE